MIMNKFYCLLIFLYFYHASVTPSFDAYDNIDYSPSLDFLCEEEIPACEKLTKAQQEFLRLHDTYGYKIGVTLQFSSLQAEQDCTVPTRKKSCFMQSFKQSYREMKVYFQNANSSITFAWTFRTMFII